MSQIVARRESESMVIITTISISAAEVEQRKLLLRNQVIGMRAQVAQLTSMIELAEAELAALDAADSLQG